MVATAKRIVWAVGVAVGVAAAIPIIGWLRWRQASADIMQRLAARASAAPDVFTAESLAGLPEPVVRYFRHVLREGQACIKAVELVQEGEFLVGSDKPVWRPLHARQRFSTRPPGFVWDARIRMAPLIPVFVRDAYVAGAGSMRAELLAVYPVVKEQGKPELDAGALQRYLAEAVWFPTALLPGQGVTWQAVDERTALAFITDAQTTVSLQFRFNEAGEVTEMFAPARFREVNGKYDPTPWAGRCTGYEEHDGIRIPVQCEVEWQLPDGPQPYWRGRIVEIRYEFAR